MLETCARPDMITEITMQPVRRHGVDAAIVFSDIVVPLKAIGVDLDIKPGVGPVVAEPIRDASGVKQLRELELDDIPYITEAVGQLVEELGSTPLIGFAGAPFTLASYLIEEGRPRNPSTPRRSCTASPNRGNSRSGGCPPSPPGSFPRRPVAARGGVRRS